MTYAQREREEGRVGKYGGCGLAVEQEAQGLIGQRIRAQSYVHHYVRVRVCVRVGMRMC